MAPRKILVSAGEASGDFYAARLVEVLRHRFPEADFFGCAGRHMRAAGVRAVVDASQIAVVGLFEVVSHIPRIYAEFRRLAAAAAAAKPDLAILTDSPDFHLRLAPRLKRLGIPVLYLVAPQVWAWRKKRIDVIRRNVDRMLCIFPFEEEFFRRHGVRADYIGHPLARIVKPSLSREEFFQKHGLEEGHPLITLLPGSRQGEISRHLPSLLVATETLRQQCSCSFLLALPGGLRHAAAVREEAGGRPVVVVEGETWDAIAHADLALAASGTVTVEAALLGTPMVTFYRVSRPSWWMGRVLVRVPFYSMVNLVAGRRVVPELMQNEMTGGSIAGEALRLLNRPADREEMKRSLAQVAARLASDADPMQKAARIAEEYLNHGVTHAL